jgi:hypothetical protein
VKTSDIPVLEPSSSIFERSTPDTKQPLIETIESQLDSNFNWGYSQERKELRSLYHRAERLQWLPEQDIDWSIPVDLQVNAMPAWLNPLHGSDVVNKLTKKQIESLNVEMGSWIVSQFLHGEQGALLASGQLVNAVPDFDAKIFISSQVYDEARHVEVYTRYLKEKVGKIYPINQDLKSLLSNVIQDSRWDIKLLGMQVIIEGLASAAFRVVGQWTLEPLIKSIITKVLADEARHVAFGVISLQDYYKDLSQQDIDEREDFIFEAICILKDRFLFKEVWEHANLDVAKCLEVCANNKMQRLYRSTLFNKILPELKQIGLMSARQKKRLNQIGVFNFGLTSRF